MKQGVKIGISLGVVALVAAAGVAVWLLIRKKRQTEAPTVPTGTVTVDVDKYGWPVFERAPGASGAHIATRANNPLDIRSSAEKWKGQIGTTSAGNGFCVFSDLEYGIRTAFKILKTYETKYGCKTLKAKLQKWAPASENRVTYADEVAAGAGVDVNSMAPYNDVNYWVKVMPYWAKLEGYEGTLTADQIKRGYKFAFN